MHASRMHERLQKTYPDLVDVPSEQDIRTECSPLFKLQKAEKTTLGNLLLDANLFAKPMDNQTSCVSRRQLTRRAKPRRAKTTLLREEFKVLHIFTRCCGAFSKIGAHKNSEIEIFFFLRP